MRILPFFILISSAALAEPGYWRVQSALQGRTNSLGIGVLTFSGYRVPLSESESLLLKGTYVEAGVRTQLSPASFHPGVYTEFVPIAPLMFRLSALRLGYFGLFGTVVDYDDKDADWSPEALDDNAVHARPAIGTAWELMGVLRLKFGRLIALHEQRYAGVHMDEVPEEQGFWYESINDVLVGRNDRIHIMKATLAWLVSGHVNSEFLIVGGQWERYATEVSEVTRQIAGGVGLWRPDASWWGKPAFAVLVGLMPEDVHRENSFYFGFQGVVHFSSE